MNNSNSTPYQLPFASSDAIQTWIYPSRSDFPIRQYQLDICRKALFQNTLVCLPTGLGKTLIAAVVMYNYHRWFPKGKVIFMAPTRPLVAQQERACVEIMGINPDETCSIEGTISPEARATAWLERSVIFCTPQTALNDLKSGSLLAHTIVCIVIDEAHKATENYAYTTFIQELNMKTSNFRVTALSATPGSDIRKIQAVVRNLNISHIDVRTEEDPEVQPYVHEKHIEIVRCGDKPASAKSVATDTINKGMESPLKRLLANGLIMTSCPKTANIFILNELEREWSDLKEDRGFSEALASSLKQDMYCVKFLLQCRRVFNDDGYKGLRSFTMQKENEEFAFKCRAILDTISSISSDPSYVEKRQPKVNKLKEILKDHFQRYEMMKKTTRALVFASLRVTVMEIKTELEKMQGIRPREFIGQGSREAKGDSIDSVRLSGLSQAEQAEILRKFNTGDYNVLVATSIAEEGLDIAEVDLIVLFDSIESSTRLVQRCGRTGRKRDGRIVQIVCETKTTSSSTEESKLEQSAESIKKLNSFLKTSGRALKFYDANPRMIPEEWPLPQLSLEELPSHKERAKKKDSVDPINKYFANNTVPEVSLVNGSGNEPIDPFAFTFLSANKSSASRSYSGTKDFSTSILSPSGFGTTKGSIKECFEIDLISPVPSVPCSPSPVPMVSLLGDSETKNNYSKQVLDSFTTSVSRPVQTFTLMNNDFFYSAEDSELLEEPDDGCKDTKLTRNPPPPPPPPPPANQSFALLGSSESSANDGFAISARHHQAPALRRPYSIMERLRNVVSSFSTSVPFLALDDDASDSQSVQSDKSSHKFNQERTSKSVANPRKATSSLPFVVASSNLLEIREGNKGKGLSKPSKQREPAQSRSQDQFCVICLERNQHSATKNTPSSSCKVGIADLDSSDSSEEEKGADGDKDKGHEDSDDEDEEEKLLRCAGRCGSYIHRTCYGDIDDSPYASHGTREWEFMCESCSFIANSRVSSRTSAVPGKSVSSTSASIETPTCALCFHSEGLMKRSTCEQWVHPVCFLFIRELTCDAITLRANNLHQLDPDRKPLLCRICRKRGGGCQQCAFGDCLLAYHPYCALTGDIQLMIWEKRDVVRYSLYCQAHEATAPKTALILGHTKPLSHISSLGKNRCDINMNETDNTPLAQHRIESFTQLQDTDEKKKQFHIPTGRQNRKRLKKQKEIDDRIRERKRRKKMAALQRNAALAGMFELEAEKSGSEAEHADDDSEEREDNDDDDESSDQLSGDFLNDGDYTQHSDACDDPQLLYLDVNRRRDEEESPGDFLMIREMMKGKRANTERVFGPPKRKEVLEDSILVDSDGEVIDEFAEGWERDGESDSDATTDSPPSKLKSLKKNQNHRISVQNHFAHSKPVATKEFKREKPSASGISTKPAQRLETADQLHKPSIRDFEPLSIDPCKEVLCYPGKENKISSHTALSFSGDFSGQSVNTAPSSGGFGAPSANSLVSREGIINLVKQLPLTQGDDDSSDWL